MATQNFSNRAIFRGDNLDFLRNINSESVDLIATEPPFNKNQDFHALPQQGCGREFQRPPALG